MKCHKIGCTNDLDDAREQVAISQDCEETRQCLGLDFALFFLVLERSCKPASFMKISNESSSGPGALPCPSDIRIDNMSSGDSLNLRLLCC